MHLSDHSLRQTDDTHIRSLEPEAFVKEPEHRFGGPWTDIKLKLLRGYLHFYTQALKKQPFKLLYIDAFAGTGYHTVGSDQSGLFASERRLKGSAQIALELERPFDHYVFIEWNTRRFQVLETLRRQYPQHQIECLRGEANSELQDLCARIAWCQYRAALFLDPYGLSVAWTTLQRIARTQAIDLWYWFSLSGLYRQTARDFERVDPAGAARLDSVLGTPDWREAFYAPAAPAIVDLFGDPVSAAIRRHARVDAIEAFVGDRLRAAGFARVAEPLRLPLRGGAPLYSLFFCVANPKAITLSMHAADHLLKSARR